MKPFAIAGLQLHISGARDNIPYLRSRVDHVAGLFPWVQMVVFSELSAFGPATAKAQPMPGPAERAFQDMAAKHSLWIVSGSMFELKDGKTFNTATVIDPSGKVVTRHRKMFPFLPYEVGVSAGTDFCLFDVPDVGRFAVSICYDMWFPETSRTLAVSGAEVIIHPTMTGTIDRDCELSIVRATAVINQCYVFDVNGLGDGGIGRSLIVGPAGDVLHQAGTSEEMFPLEIDLDRVRRGREFGVKGLGQPLKSFRDAPVEFTIYRNPEERRYLRTLGPLECPKRGSVVGLNTPAPAIALREQRPAPAAAHAPAAHPPAAPHAPAAPAAPPAPAHQVPKEK